MFDKKKPLGEHGAQLLFHTTLRLYFYLFSSVGHKWIKIHLCNLFGKNKMSFKDREKWTESKLELAYLSAQNPIENQFWAEAEEPFQVSSSFMYSVCFLLVILSSIGAGDMF